MAFQNRWSLRITLRKEVEHCSSCNKQWAKFGDLLAKTGEDARGEEDTPNSDDDANPDAPVERPKVVGVSFDAPAYTADADCISGDLLAKVRLEYDPPIYRTG